MIRQPRRHFTDGRSPNPYLCRIKGLTNVVNFGRVDFVALGLFDGRQSFGQFGQTLLNPSGLLETLNREICMHLIMSDISCSSKKTDPSTGDSVLVAINEARFEVVIVRVLFVEAAQQTLGNSVPVRLCVAVSEAFHIPGGITQPAARPLRQIRHGRCHSADSRVSESLRIALLESVRPTDIFFVQPAPGSRTATLGISKTAGIALFKLATDPRIEPVFFLNKEYVSINYNERTSI